VPLNHGSRNYVSCYFEIVGQIPKGILLVWGAGWLPFASRLRRNEIIVSKTAERDQIPRLVEAAAKGCYRSAWQRGS
jgi:hypothetical protein